MVDQNPVPIVPPVPNQVPAGVGSGIWSKGIPGANNISMVISLILVFGLDLIILINSPSLFMFWAAMLVVLAIFGFFYFIENRFLKKRYSSSQSKIDPWISILVGIRNFVFILNFIPGIQILGGVALVFGGIPYLLVYYILVRMRWGAAHAS